MHPLERFEAARRFWSHSYVLEASQLTRLRGLPQTRLFGAYKKALVGQFLRDHPDWYLGDGRGGNLPTFTLESVSQQTRRGGATIRLEFLDDALRFSAGTPSGFNTGRGSEVVLLWLSGDAPSVAPKVAIEAVARCGLAGLSDEQILQISGISASQLAEVWDEVESRSDRLLYARAWKRRQSGEPDDVSDSTHPRAYPSL